MPSAEAFRITSTLTLSNGVEVTVRKPDVARLIMESSSGDVPEFLTAQVMSGIKGKKSVSVDLELQADDLPAMSKFMDTVVRAALVWPQIVDSDPDYEAGQILITDIQTPDRMTIFTWAMPEEAPAAARFRGEPNGHVALAQPGKSLPNPTQ